MGSRLCRLFHRAQPRHRTALYASKPNLTSPLPRAEVEKLRGQLEACEKHLAIKEAVIQDLGQLAARLSHDRP
jgi:hypothetical protein